MPRIADTEINRIKTEVSLVDLVQGKGIELKKHGSKDLKGLCPFHDDHEPSMIVTPEKNLFHCMSCGKAGTVIDFLMQHESISFREAALKLGAREHDTPTCPLTYGADNQTILNEAITYYHSCLPQAPGAIAYLKKRAIYNEEAIKTFKIGFCDKSLGTCLPSRHSTQGIALRQQVAEVGLYRKTGHEHFYGCLVFPIINNQGHVKEVYGRRTNKSLKGSTINHLYLPGPHEGIFNPQALESDTLIITESIIDALTFWVNGHRNVTCIYGTEGFTDELSKTIQAHNIPKIYLAYDRDEAGERATKRDAARLGALGTSCHHVQFPSGMDANEYARQVKPAHKSLQTLLHSAQLIEGTVHSTSTLSLVANKLAAKEKNERSESSSTPVEEKPLSVLASLREINSDYYTTLGARNYRIRGLQKNTTTDALKINLRLAYEDKIYLDMIDLYKAKDRHSFMQPASKETGLGEDIIRKDLGKLLNSLEELQESLLAQREQRILDPQAPTMSAKDKEEALALLKDPRLLKLILEAFEACGIVGESINKLAGYIAAVSRKLDKPLAIIVQSTSAAGKSSLMDAVLHMMPEEERIKYSAMTGQSLYYLGEADLKHKILAIVEEEGAEKASYALKLLQSEGELTIASTSKDDKGRMKTEEYRVEGPVMIFLTTTAIDIDEELQNRCLILTVDETREQTKRIQQIQRQTETYKGLELNMERQRLFHLHRNAQRLLKPVHVVNPYADRLTFVSDKTRTRRDHMKYLTLIKTITLLHQYQRPLITKGNHQYIEVTLSDIEAANKIAHEVLGCSLDELPPQTRRLLKLIEAMVSKTCSERNIDRSDFLFSRKLLREFTGWNNTQLKVHLDRLEDHEYIVSHRGMRGQSYVYELLFDGDAASDHRQLIGLIDVENLRSNTTETTARNQKTIKFAGVNDEFTGANGKFAPPKRPQNGGFTGQQNNPISLIERCLR